MKILILGNGFDLAHRLQTTYKDFLRFGRRFREFEWAVNTDAAKHDSESALAVIDSQNDEIYADILSSFFENPNSKEEEALVEGIIYNCWFEYFDKIQGIDHWVDFEAEIQKVLNTLAACPIVSPIENNRVELTFDARDIYNSLGLSLKSCVYIRNQLFVSLDELEEELLSALNKFTTAFELYLVLYVKKFSAERLPLIESFLPDAILSFNYTDTYNRLYDTGSCLEYAYIHGKATGTSEGEGNNHIVLGVEDCDNNSEDKNTTRFIGFKKFYQRVIKRTGLDENGTSGIQHKKWIEQITREGNAIIEQGGTPTKSEAVFWGHSFAVSDREILSEIITNPYIDTTIYYHDEHSFQSIVANLVNVIGRDTLLEFMYCATPKLKFMKI